MPARKRAKTSARRTPKRVPAKAARKISRKAAPKPARKAARKAARKPARKPAPARRATAAKPARKTARKPARKPATKPRRRSRAVETIPIPPARRRTRSVGRSRERKAPEVIPRVVFDDQAPAEAVGPSAAPLPAQVSDGERDARPYVAVVSQIDRTEPFPEQTEPPLLPTTARARAEAEHHPTDIPIVLTSTLLVVSVFLEWYTGPSGLSVSVTGWASGTLAPLILFFAAGSILLVALRRFAGLSVSLPVEESLAHEVTGWLSLAAAVVKIRWRPSVVGFGLTTSYGVWIAIGAAALLIVLAGRMSPRAPLVFRPGWHRDRAGSIGLVGLLVVIAGSAAFGAINSPSLTAESTSNPDLFRGTVRGKIPDCARGFPFPSGLKPEYGFDTATTCQAQLSSSQRSTALIDAFKASLTAGKWTFTEVKGATGSSIFSITKPRCASLAIVPDRDGSIVAVSFTRCPSPTPTPT